jgi:DNA polymerase V
VERDGQGNGIVRRAVSDEVKYLYRPGICYRKTGIVFFGLEKPGTAHQMDLFDTSSSSQIPHPSSLYKAVDALNAKYGKGKVFSAAEGIGKRSWHMKREKLSHRPTTRWDELLIVK